ncbi:hypothetical protein FNH22_14155 [Fulvivirga sp. M361]|uniref:hypothetical protein n=1 Tax=Fulvivirga sp. M361 TaxID=2594266 RepID=UPI00117B781E|nr:hypothetical protein [Fulvivirga sp. M361]TRX58202.1 hypothetical protein FNH22_14155 [Fulvivirga sp. M361]
MSLYADLVIARKGGEGGSRAAHLMNEVFFNEGNFRTGQTWMVKAQLEKLVSTIGPDDVRK